MKSPVYSSVKYIPKNGWKYPHFKPSEIACKDGSIMWDSDAMAALERLRKLVGKPMVINSAYRSPAYNAKVGGAKRSYHMIGEAFDVDMGNHDPVKFEALARQAGFTGFGFYRNQNFIHIDIGPARDWGDRWRVEGRAPDAPPASLVKAAGSLKAKRATQMEVTQ